MEKKPPQFAGFLWAEVPTFGSQDSLPRSLLWKCITLLHYAVLCYLSSLDLQDRIFLWSEARDHICGLSTRFFFLRRAKKQKDKVSCMKFVTSQLRIESQAEGAAIRRSPCASVGASFG